MTDRNRRPEGQYGFARGQRGEPTRLLKTVPASPISMPGDQNWVVRPKKSRPSVAKSPVGRREAGGIRRPTITTGSPGSAPSRDGKNWLALGLVSMIFVGAAVAWSMLQAIEEAVFPTPMPVAIRGTLPPLDGAVDVIDARADRPFIPKFRPEAAFGTGNELAASDFQKKI